MKPEEIIDATKSRPIPAVEIWWSREYQRYIATAPVIAGVFGMGPSFAEAARCLEDALAAWIEHGNAIGPHEPKLRPERVWDRCGCCDKPFVRLRSEEKIFCSKCDGEHHETLPNDAR